MRPKIKLHSITKNLFPEYFQFHLRITGKFDKAFALACNKSPQNSNMYFSAYFQKTDLERNICFLSYQQEIVIMVICHSTGGRN